MPCLSCFSKDTGIYYAPFLVEEEQNGLFNYDFKAFDDLLKIGLRIGVYDHYNSNCEKRIICCVGILFCCGISFFITFI